MTLLELRVPPSPWNAGVVRDQLVGVGKTMDMSEEDLEDFVTAVGEAFANAVLHAHSNDSVEIDVNVDDRQTLIAIVRDRGCGIEGAPIAERLPPAAAERGRGIPLMRRCSTSFAISTHPAGGTLVVMTWEPQRRSQYTRVTHGFAQNSDNVLTAQRADRFREGSQRIVDVS
jgi:anti-sigma regulatory factor (Ser/Thr protein kinase)